MSLLIRQNLCRNSNNLLYTIQNRLFSETNQNKKYDLVVIGGGIIGTASAREILLRNPHLNVAILEKEKTLAVHQSGHNSGVIHAGIYYKPGSLKAKLCVEGLHLSYTYLNENKIPYKKCGKLIVATNDMEVQRLMDLFNRGLQNKVPGMQLIDSDKIEDIEPYCVGVKAIWSPETGIVDWKLVTNYYGRDFRRSGGHIHLDFEAKKFIETPTPNADHPITIIGNYQQMVKTKYVLTCGGLQSDKLAALTNCPRSPRIVPFRGEYLLLCPEKCSLINGNIYPVPDPRFPFLGVHFTPRMDGSVWLGPNAVLAFKREGYKWSDINPLDLCDTLRYPGFLRMARKYIGFGLNEMAKSMFIPLQIKDLQRFVPIINEYDVRSGPAGVRAQALDDMGNLVDDFVFHYGKSNADSRHGNKINVLNTNIIHLRNAPSPGATSSMAIAKMIADKLEKDFSLTK